MMFCIERDLYHRSYGALLSLGGHGLHAEPEAVYPPCRPPRSVEIALAVMAGMADTLPLN
jgi:hypothetical protein